MTVGVDRHELRQITAALAMHRAASLDELGGTVDAYRARDALRYRNTQAPNRYPMERVVSGETFHDVIVAVRRADKPEVVPRQFEAEERLEARFAVRERRILDHICQGLDYEAIVWGRDNGFPLSSPG